ncbi:MAG: type III pantothenate kinase [Caldilineales bacterium]|nr:type III pantothenate kinase [Caldilineales bacterium]
MLFAIDIGNTNIVCGLFQGAEILTVWRISSDTRRSADEHWALLRSLSAADGLDLPGQVHAAIIGSVSPVLTTALAEMCQRRLRCPPIIAHVGLDLGLEVRVKEPGRVGIDRLLNAVAAQARLGAPCIALDLGTATKFDVVDAGGAFIGGAIAPGLLTAAEALTRGAALLPRIELTPPPSPIGHDTTTAMQSGILLGYVGLIEGLLARIQAALPALPGQPPAPVIATGGLAGLILPHTDRIPHHDPALTLHGLRIVHERNR